MKRCVVSSCTNDSNSEVAFFNIPSEPVMKTSWENNMKQFDLPSSSVICEAHFKARDFAARRRKKVLKNCAIPTVFVGQSGDNVRRSSRKKMTKKIDIDVESPRKISRRTLKASSVVNRQSRSSAKTLRADPNVTSMPGNIDETEQSKNETNAKVELNAADERCKSIAEWFLLDVFEATKMITNVFHCGSTITEVLISNVEETIIDVINKLLLRISSVIITTFEKEYGFRSNLESVLSRLEGTLKRDVRQMMEDEREEKRLSDSMNRSDDNNYENILRDLRPFNFTDSKVIEEVISPVTNNHEIVINEHSYFRNKQLQKDAVVEENPTAQMLHCGFCSFKTKIKTKLRRHMGKHLSTKSYSCPICDYTTKSEQSLQKHYRTHSGLKPYGCDECEYRTANSSNLTRHMMIHTGEKPFDCPHCEYSARQKVTILAHIKGHEEERRPVDSVKEKNVYVCGDCSFVTILRREFHEHVKTHKVYNCVHCEFTSGTHKEMRCHQRVHRGAVHRCSICENVCRSAEELRTHVETHGSAVEYVCSLCAYRTSRMTYYRRHMSLHSGERPFKCQLCSRKFRLNSQLKAHTRQHEIGPFCKRSSM